MTILGSVSRSLTSGWEESILRVYRLQSVYLLVCMFVLMQVVNRDINVIVHTGTRY